MLNSEEIHVELNRLGLRLEANKSEPSYAYEHPLDNGGYIYVKRKSGQNVYTAPLVLPPDCMAMRDRIDAIQGLYVTWQPYKSTSLRHYPKEGQTKPRKSVSVAVKNDKSITLTRSPEDGRTQYGYAADVSTPAALNELVGVLTGTAYFDTNSTRNDTEKESFMFPLNQILFGPPGTGKTYATTELAVRIAEPDWWQDEAIDSLDETSRRTMVKARYEKLIAENRVGFTTFHQSFSYEDFIEGIRAETDERTQALKYCVVDGVFKKLSDNAGRAVSSNKPGILSPNPRIWKISIYERGATEKRNACLDRGEARIGWSGAGDLSEPLEQRSEAEQAYWNKLSWTDQNTIEAFANEINVGDVLLCLKDATSIQAVGIVASPYRYSREDAEAGDFANILGVHWLLRDIDVNIVELNDNKKLTLKTLYPLNRINWDDLVAALREQGYEVPLTQSPQVMQAEEKPPYVLIIDEINRGNISRIFGELITLLEPNKRKGGTDERTVILPYSKMPFQVPSNVYVIGTMNTADRSLAQLDLALRRRFSFIETPPQPELLRDVAVHGIDMADLLDTINQRIEVLLDRDHLLGHAYLFPLKDLSTEDERVARLGQIFSNNIIPLLQEYFFDDWERIRWVLNDHRKKSADAQFITNGGNTNLQQLFGSELQESLSERRFRVNADALYNPDAYRSILHDSDS